MATSDLTLSIIIVLIFIGMYAFNLFVIGTKNIKDNWPIYRCQPLIMPFASVFGHDTNTNFAYCIQTMQKGFMDDLLRPLHFNFGALGGITSGISATFDKIRGFEAWFRDKVKGAFGSIFATVFNVMIEIQRMIITMKDLLGKLIGIMTTSLYVIDGSMKTMQSAWSGPPGALVRALCFHPNTLLKLQNGEMVAMKDVPLNSVMVNGTRVLAVMQISNLDENGAIIEKMYRVKAKNGHSAAAATDILVSGSHLIYDPTSEKFVHVKELSAEAAEMSETDCEVLSCLITSDHTIPIGDWIFHDWEDNNGSAAKSI
jgi:hypothetical protein